MAAHCRRQIACLTTVQDPERRPIRNRVVQCAVLVPDDGVAFIAKFVERLVVDPHILGELELAHQAGANDERGDTALHTVIGRILG